MLYTFIYVYWKIKKIILLLICISAVASDVVMSKILNSFSYNIQF